MTREGSCSERPARARREVLCADLDRLDADSGLWQQANGDGSPLREMRCEAVRAAIATALTETQRRAVEAHFFEGLSQGQIARRFGVSQQVVQKCLYGAPRGGRVVLGTNDDHRHVNEDRRHVNENHRHVNDDHQHVNEDHRHVDDNRRHVNDDHRQAVPVHRDTNDDHRHVNDDR